MQYDRVSADCLIDLRWMPPDLFVTGARPSMRGRMPYVTGGVWPQSGKYIADQFARLPAGRVRKIAGDNAVQFYGLNG